MLCGRLRWPCRFLLRHEEGRCSKWKGEGVGSASVAPCGAQAGSESAWAGAIALSLGRGALLAWLGTVVASLLVSAVGAGLLIARGSDDSKWQTVHVEFTYQLGDYRYTNRAALREGDWISKLGPRTWATRGRGSRATRRAGA